MEQHCMNLLSSRLWRKQHTQKTKTLKTSSHTAWALEPIIALSLLTAEHISITSAKQSKILNVSEYPIELFYQNNFLISSQIY